MSNVTSGCTAAVWLSRHFVELLTYRWVCSDHTEVLEHLHYSSLHLFVSVALRMQYVDEKGTASICSPVSNVYRPLQPSLSIILLAGKGQD